MILIPETLGDAEIQRAFDLANRSPRLARAARVIITASKASHWTEAALSDPLLTTTQATDGPDLMKAVEAAPASRRAAPRRENRHRLRLASRSSA